MGSGGEATTQWSHGLLHGYYTPLSISMWPRDMSCSLLIQDAAICAGCLPCCLFGQTLSRLDNPEKEDDRCYDGCNENVGSQLRH